MVRTDTCLTLAHGEAVTAGTVGGHALELIGVIQPEEGGMDDCEVVLELDAWAVEELWQRYGGACVLHGG